MVLSAHGERWRMFELISQGQRSPTQIQIRRTQMSQRRGMSGICRETRGVTIATRKGGGGGKWSHQAGGGSGGSGGGGTKYLELEAGRGEGVKVGDVVEIYFKVLKLGKRSYDGLSGEGTVVFSRGYGLEDDEKPLVITRLHSLWGKIVLFKH
eukprot:CCRYP_017181-RD/>CCRYP_017181-RD protein AED:0.35 eAED:0.35 QI:0/0.75/0.6/1/0/0/5/1431/152